MQVLFDGTAPVAYGQIYVTSRELPDMSKAFAGQVNGLCGAREPGELFLITGTHTGEVRFTVELHEAEPPPAAPEWEEVVEAPFRLRAGTVDLVPWGDGTLAELPLTPAGLLPDFRVRYCAAGMDAGSDPFGGFDPDQIDEDDYTYMKQRPDRYLLCFWPEPASGDPATHPAGDTLRPEAIVRQTSAAAAYWHNWAAAQPAPPTLWEQVEAEQLKRLEQERRNEEYRRREETRRWGGRAPSDRLRRIHGNVYGIAVLDRDLVDGVAEADDATQRRIAIWAARRAFTFAGIADLDWMAPAWVALERGDPLPAEFTDVLALLTRVRGREPVIVSSISARWLSLDPVRDSLDSPVDPVAMALPALAAAAQPDPLQAALEALWAGVSAYATRRAEFLAEVRQAFPIVDV